VLPPEAKKAQNGKDDDDEPDEIDNAVHGSISSK